MVVDNNSSSMAAAGKLNTVIKTIIGEQVSDLAPVPQGTEFNIYTFNAGSAALNPARAGQEFFANQIMPRSMPSSPTAPTPVPRARPRRAIAGHPDQIDGDAWFSPTATAPTR